MGGIIAMDFAARYPERLLTLTVCDSSEGLGDLPADQRRDFIRSRQEPLLAGKEPRDIADEVARSLTSSSAPESVYRRLFEGMAALHKETYLKALEAVANVRGLKLEEISAPTHVVVGALDRLAPPPVSRRLSERIAGAELSIVPEAGHIANIEQPQAFSDIVLGFLNRYR
jgi:3-oxoadipate enol-lactonase